MSTLSGMPSPDAPLSGSCTCGTVRFQVTAPFQTAGYCHCTRCHRRTGTLSSLTGMVDADGFEILEGADALRTYRPPDGWSKSFCVHCGGHILAADPEEGGLVGVRLGTVHGDPGIRPSWRQWVSSTPDWEPIPDDGLPRFPERREHD
jgi:hypothetical protein